MTSGATPALRLFERLRDGAAQSTLLYEMSNPSLAYEIHRINTPDGGVELELVVEGVPVAHASASGSNLDDIQTLRGQDRDAVISELEQVLLDALKTLGQFVKLKELVEDPRKNLRFSTQFIYRLRDQVSTGIVWYDVAESATGPESVPAVVRHEMRQEVHRKLTEPGTAARALVDRA